MLTTIQTVILSFISILSTFFLSSKEIQKMIPSSFWNSKTKKVVSTLTKILLIGLVFVAFSIPFWTLRSEKKVKMEIEEICGTAHQYLIKGNTKLKIFNIFSICEIVVNDLVTKSDRYHIEKDNKVKLG